MKMDIDANHKYTNNNNTSNNTNSTSPPPPQPPGNNINNNFNTNNKKDKNCCKRVTKFLFSHIGLVLMVGLYAVAGAFLFELLEQHEEAKDCQEGKGAESTNIVNLKSTLLTYIQFNISSVSTDTGKDNETVANEKIEKWLTEFRDQVLDIKSTYRYTGQDCSVSKWNFPGALLFVITIFTTIGYGHITPVTWEGQIVCICYATIGIPLFLMFLSNISGVLGDMFRFVYARICCRLCMNKKGQNSKRNSVKDLASLETNKQIEKPDKSNDELAIVDAENEAETTPNENSLVNNVVNSTSPKIIDDPEDSEQDLKDENDEEKVTVPLTITMIILTLYIILGAVIFHQFENWGLVAAGYFCYITLTTIGFGDFVPGQTEGDSQSSLKLIAGAIYLLFGMAILAMCFDLMQEEIIAKFTWLGKKMGIVDKDDEEEEETSETKEPVVEEKKIEPESLMREKTKEMIRRERPSFVSERTQTLDSPVPSYSTTDKEDNRETISRHRSSFMHNVVHRQVKS